MRHLVTRLILTLAVLCFAATSASALDIDVEFNLGNSLIANAVTVDAANAITVVLTNGDVFAFDVIVSNAPMDTVTALFTSLVTDVTQLAFAGGAFSNILTEATCTGFLCSPATLAPGIGAPISKPNDPESAGTGVTEWIQATAHTNPTGANGAGPDMAVLLAYTYIGAGGSEEITIGAAITAGDASAGVVDPINFSGATINVPEPGMLAASLASLASVALIAGARRRQDA